MYDELLDGTSGSDEEEVLKSQEKVEEYRL